MDRLPEKVEAPGHVAALEGLAEPPHPGVQEEMPHDDAEVGPVQRFRHAVPLLEKEGEGMAFQEKEGKEEGEKEKEHGEEKEKEKEDQ